MEWFNELKKYALRLRDKGRQISRDVYVVCYAIFGLYSLIMSFVCLGMNQITMTVVNAVIGIWLLISIVLLFVIKHPKWATYNTVIFFMVVMIYFLISGGADGFSIIWMFMVPVAGMYLLGLYYGSFTTIWVGLVLSIYMWTPLHKFGYQYTQGYLIRFPMVYWAVSGVCLIIFIKINNYEDEQRRMLKEMEEASKAKSNFLANMSHEIRTPMNAILGMCELSLQEDLADDVREQCENVQTSGKNLLGIINDLLDFSKIESGKMELICEEYSLSELLNDVIVMTLARKGDKAIEFLVNVDPNIPNRLFGDKVRIRQVLVNLLTNAVKYTEHGGVLFTVSARVESYGINLVVTVKDSGIGIEEKEMGNIFSSFSQVDTKKNRAVEGTGLGLPITKNLVQMMNGVIMVNSEYGKGSEFKVVIPQKVVDTTPIITLKEPQRTEVLCYIDMRKFDSEFIKEGYRKIIDTMGECFGINMHCCTSKEVMNNWLKNHNCSHLFIGKEEYLEDKALYESLAEELEVVVMQDKQGGTSVDGKVKTLYKPLYCLPTGNVLNREKVTFSTVKKEPVLKRFTAKQAKVLVVDDNQMNVKVAIGLLRPYQMSVVSAICGEEALALVKEQDFDLIFMDHMMPEMDGVEVVSIIRASDRESLRTVPIIAFTANAVSGMREMFFAAGFQDFVSKPIEGIVLRDTLLKWLPADYIEYEEENDHGK